MREDQGAQDDRLGSGKDATIAGGAAGAGATGNAAQHSNKKTGARPGPKVNEGHNNDLTDDNHRRQQDHEERDFDEDRERHDKKSGKGKKAAAVGTGAAGAAGAAGLAKHEHLSLIHI